jgi:uncharacterized membrane protein
MSAVTAPRRAGVRLRAASAAVAVAGLAISVYLTVVHYAGGDPVCAIAHGCATVQQSRYAELAGVPVALLGVGGYLAILVSLARDGEGWRTAGAFLALAGLGFSAWLTWVEVGVLDAICIWCVGSALCMAALASLTVMRMIGPRQPAHIADAMGRVAGAPPVRSEAAHHPGVPRRLRSGSSPAGDVPESGVSRH